MEPENNNNNLPDNSSSGNNNEFKNVPGNMIIFYVFVIILSVSIVVATILITYRYFYGPDDSEDYQSAYTEDGRSELLEGNNIETVETQNAISINGMYVDGYTNELETTNEINIVILDENLIGNNVQNVVVNNVEDNTLVNETVANNTVQEEVAVKKESLLKKHDFNVVLTNLMPKYTKDTKSKVKGVYSSDEKQIFLTFDDGPSKLTPEILDILKQYNVKATFFVMGRNVDLHPEITKRAYEEGHFIANHSYTHEYSKLYSSVQNVVNEYNRTEKAIQDAIGVSAYHSYLFRFPGGSSGGHYDSLKARARETLDKLGVAYTNWNCMTGDAEGKNTVEAQLKTLYETAEDETSLVILMHDASDKKATVETLPKIIEHYQALGYEFKTYYEIMN